MADAGDVRRMRAIGDLVASRGVEVRWMSGWESRGATWARVPVGLVDHHDASSIKSGEWGALGIIVSGRTGIPGPLSQFLVARCLDGQPRLAIAAAGRANHAGLGGAYRFPDGLTVPRDDGNAWLYGVEKANNGLGEAITAAANYAADCLFRTVLEVCG